MNCDECCPVRRRTHGSHCGLHRGDINRLGRKSVEVPEQPVEIREGEGSSPMTTMNAKREGLPEIIDKRLPRTRHPVAQPRLKEVLTIGGERSHKVPVSQLQVEVVLRTRCQGISVIELVQIR